MNPTWDGMLLLDKPCGPTSHDIVDLVRGATGQRRVGHAGTLDPLASGLLPVVLGRATRLVRYLPSSPKEYVGTLRLGLTTRTDDAEGDIVARHDGPLPTAELALAAAARLRGDHRQRPPAVSARKVGGRRLYALARRGLEVEAEPRPVRVLRFELTAAADDPARFSFVAEVSAGTYVRALVRDLGQQLGCGAIVTSLRRTAIGPMRLIPELRIDSKLHLPIERLRSHLVPAEDMPLDPPPLRLPGDAAAARFGAGTPLPVEAAGIPDGPCRVLDPRGRLLGVAELTGGILRPRVVLV